jgi:hypothetical protein
MKQQKKEETEWIKSNDNEGLKVGVKNRLEDLSCKELIDWLTKATIFAKSKGSAPISGNDKSHLLISDQEESMSNDSSHFSSSSGESSEESKDGADSG